MNRRIGWTVGLLLLAGTGVVATIGLVRPGFDGLSIRPAAAPPHADDIAPALGYQTEQEWIVWDVTRTIAQIATFANTGGTMDAAEQVVVTTDPADPAQPHASPRFSIRIGSRAPLRVIANNHIWAPEGYEDVARTLLGRATPYTDPHD